MKSVKFDWNDSQSALNACARSAWKTALAVALVTGMTGSVAQAATLIGPVYPAPGGNSFSSSGTDAGDAGGVNWSYSGFNTGAFTKLYWGPWDSNSVQAGLDGNLHNLSFVSYTSNQAEWSAGSLLDGFGNSHSVDFLLTIESGPVSFVSATSVGLPSSLGALINDSSGANYTVNLAFLADGITPINALEQPSSDLTVLSFSGGFYYAPGPGPGAGLASLVLLLLAGTATKARGLLAK
jgi:hypothetical protein